MLRSSLTAIFRLLLVCCSSALSNSGIVGPEWLGVIVGVTSGFKVVSVRERILGVKRFWLTGTGKGALRLG